MKHTMKAALVPAMLVATLMTAGAANAQMASPNSPSTSGTRPGATSDMTSPSPSAPALGATSQAAPQRSNSAAPASVSNSANPRTTQAPVAGANSFTEGQARARFAEKGFNGLTGLTKDDKGVWRATAMKDGKSTPVALDYQGNIVSQ